MRKWPYHDHAKTPVPLLWYEKPFIQAWGWVKTQFGELRQLVSRGKAN